ncbi:hypothetical protein FJTKL_06745 [Diaporthe vaccinii]|uniref:Uncharacterized protein n=1 Tax=Diaporthe vaccinii TaxID=105482 RepID=A0ABR4DQ59_9PEZI
MTVFSALNGPRVAAGGAGCSSLTASISHLVWNKAARFLPDRLYAFPSVMHEGFFSVSRLTASKATC